MLVVPGRPAARGLTWWVLTDDGRDPSLELLGPGGAAAVVTVCPLDPARLPGAVLVGATGLSPDSAYTLRASSPGGGAPAEARARTLPDAVPAGQKLTLALGSCFSVAQDKGLLAAAYPPDRYGPGREPIHLRLLMGDQLYMDLDPASGSPIVLAAPKVWERYLGQWRAPQFSPFISASPNLMMADDHEFWNDYPHGNVWLPWAYPENAAVADFDPAFSVFQAALNVDPAKVAALRDADPLARARFLAREGRTFELPASPVSIFMLDTRTHRTRFDAARPRVTDQIWLDDAVAWLGNLAGPAVFVVSQPMVEKPVGWFARTTHTMGDVNLPDYRADFATLWKAVLDAPHDVLILSGDIHWNRLYRVSTGARPDHSVFELIASPLARIKQGSDVKDVQETAGKVEWADGNASWSRLFAENGKTSYVTVTFTGATPVAVEVALWGQRTSTTAASTPVAQASFKLA